MIIDDVRTNLMRQVAEQTKTYRGIERLRYFIPLAKEAWHNYRLARKSHSFNPFTKI